jgi:hypothetical protein
MTFKTYFQLQPHHTPQQDAHSEEWPELFQVHVTSSRQMLGLSPSRWNSTLKQGTTAAFQVPSLSFASSNLVFDAI